MHKYIVLLCVLFQACVSFKIGFNAELLDDDRAVVDNETTKISFQLYTNQNPTEFQEFFLHDLNAVLVSNYDPTLPTKIYAPGWNNTGVSGYPMRDEYLSREDCNFIIINWIELQSKLGNGGLVTAVRTTETAGKYASVFVNFLIENGTPLSSLHLIGHSAGSHLSGVLGSEITAGKVPRISGLDPGDGPWNLDDIETCLDPSDAEFVDVIHTNGGRVINGQIGVYKPIGHADFYPNGGQKQPGCGTPEQGCCSHCRAVQYFAESINSKLDFGALQCDSYEAFQAGLCNGNVRELMGDPLSTMARGVFYIDTNEQAPFARG